MFRRVPAIYIGDTGGPMIASHSTHLELAMKLSEGPHNGSTVQRSLSGVGDIRNNQLEHRMQNQNNEVKPTSGHQRAQVEEKRAFFVTELMSRSQFRKVMQWSQMRNLHATQQMLMNVVVVGCMLECCIEVPARVESASL